MLVADALNVVFTKTVLEHGWAFERLHCNDLRPVPIFQAVACANSSCRASGRRKCSKSHVRIVACFCNMLVHGRQRSACYFVVTEVIAKLAELIENEILDVFLHFIASVINFFHIAFCSWCANDVARIARPLVEPIKTFLRHSSRQYGNAACAHDFADGHATARIVAS